MIKFFKAIPILTLLLILSFSCSRTTGGGVLPIIDDLRAPENLRASALSSSSIALAWDDKSPDSEGRGLSENGFYIERAQTLGGEYTRVGEVAENVEEFTDSGLTASTTYYYRVMAFANAGVSESSNIANATTLSNTSPPPPPPPGPFGIQEGTVESERINGTAVDHESNVYVTGYTKANIVGTNTFGDVYRSGKDVFVIKYDSEGNALWKRQFGSIGENIDEEGNAIFVRHGNVYVAGYTYGALAGTQGQNAQMDIFLLRLNASTGAVNLQKQVGSGQYEWQSANGVAADNSGNIFLTGFTEGTLPGATGTGRAFFIKYDSNGNMIRTRQIGEDFDDAGISIAVDSENKIYATGNTNGSYFGASKGGQDVFFIQLANDLDTLRMKQFGTGLDDYAGAIAVSSNSFHIYIAGMTKGVFEGGGYTLTDNLFVLKTTSGEFPNPLWVKQLDSSEPDRAYGVFADTAGNVYVSGETRGNLVSSSSGSYDAFLIKYDSNGESRKGIQIGTEYNERAQNVVLDIYDNIIISGHTHGALAGSHEGLEDIFVFYLEQSDLANF